MNDDSEFSHPKLSFCEGASQTAVHFKEQLSTFEPGSDARKEFLKTHCDSQNHVLQITSIQEIGKSGDPEWLNFLQARLHAETGPFEWTLLLCAIGELGGFRSWEDYAPYLESEDEHVRTMALFIPLYLPREEALAILVDKLNHDPSLGVRQTAARRLVDLDSDAGLPLLLEEFHQEEQQYSEKTRLAFLLTVLRHPEGLQFLQQQIGMHPSLSRQDRTLLFSAVCDVFLHEGLELPPCERPADLPLEIIFQRATDWLEAQLGAIAEE
ncbi:HEAT repeat domain-containing protein [Gimesia chilikensis]|uniref:HEAT repeat domain-containing protein n=1 Tax=Gimesia chilikensis TaxID=2605989 RepID=A0A517PZ20_9PLAN|nr:hypothetical protein [Gimesia chilikensis]QDT24636.1 hypothetical protein HG66A1_64710 [Gimesia chilikensis]